MDLEDFRSVLDTAGVDVWAIIDAAIAVASADDGGELRRRRDGIVERLYAATSALPRCRNCDGETKIRSKSSNEEEDEEEEEEEKELDPFGGLFDEEQKKILEIKLLLEDPNQSEESLLELLQNLADMDITFQALEETDIGRHVNRLRKHSSNEVRRLVKLLVRKWKETVDEWVKLKAPGGEPPATILADEDSPEQKSTQNVHHHQIPDFGYSPNPHNGNFGSERNHSSEAEPEPKPKAIPRKEAPPKPAPSPSVSTPSPAPPQNRQREQRESNFDAQRLDSARKRLQQNYKEAANAKKQRTIQVMDLHELPKPKKNAFFGKNKGGAGSQGRHW